jgi:hypothetical protein
MYDDENESLSLANSNACQFNLESSRSIPFASRGPARAKVMDESSHHQRKFGTASF